jgi:hypothetical protein
MPLKCQSVPAPRSSRATAPATQLPIPVREEKTRVPTGCSSPGLPTCRLVELGLPTFIHQRCSWQHIRRGEASLEAVLQQLSALPRPLGGAKPEAKCTGWGCKRAAAGSCSGRCCEAHCGDLLCPCHQKANVARHVAAAAAAVTAVAAAPAGGPA